MPETWWLRRLPKMGRGARNPELRQRQKGLKWYSGIKVHISADTETKVTHSVTTTPLHGRDVTEVHLLWHCCEKHVLWQFGRTIREKVKPPLMYVKKRIGYAQMNYCGLANRTQRMTLLMGINHWIKAVALLGGLSGGKLSSHPRNKRKAA